ncbi:MAG: hypothetical protein O3C40_37820 [Planctomycetota bacterium]|nr:hypothetical protein [Planctomycetota bacterium]
MIPAHRQPALALIHGAGLEVGALHEPFPLPPGTTVTYADSLKVDEAVRLFPEIDESKTVPSHSAMKSGIGG